ncbi:MAG: XRE family transcriptional regulator [Lachnospiraceae bacterium]|nr:XRE family transcriptional regulator [Lachnospiraceae bacterium]
MFSKNLKYYRLKQNMSKKDLAAACGITSMAITNYESGIRTPDMQTINKLASVLGVHVVDFIASRNSGLEFEHKEFRKTTQLTKAQQEYIRESVEEYCSRFFDAVDFLGGNQLPIPPKVDCLKISNNRQEDAISLRKWMGLPVSGPVDDLIGILENNGFIIMLLDIENDHFAGMNGMVNEYPYIVVNKNIRQERLRTTVAHELVHLMFNWAGHTDDKLNEKYATAVAGSFLITDGDLQRELGIKRTRLTKDLSMVCREYGVSMYLLVKRAVQAGIMSESLETEFNIKANQAAWRKHEPNRVRIKEYPRLFEQLVYRAINEEGISIQKGVELLQMSYDEVFEHCGQMEVLG